MEVKERLAALRKAMQREGISAYIVPSTDPHSGEYIPERWKSRAWISGFNGSAGIAVITLDDAALWTDSRYFIAAAQQLAGTGIRLMKEKIEGTPSQVEWLAQVLPAGATVAVDGFTNTAESVMEMCRDLETHGMKLRTDIDLIDEVWADRPSVPKAKAEVHPLRFAGESAKSKIERLRAELGGKTLLVSMLEEVAWTLNLRGTDVLYTPFVVSYLLVGPEAATLYIDPDKLTPEVEAHLAQEGVGVRPYDAIRDDVAKIDGPVVADPGKTNYAVFSAIKQLVAEVSPVGKLMIFKNKTEIDGFRSAMEKDGVAMVKWIKWLLDNVGKQRITELSAARKLEELRAEQEHFRGISFESIIGYGPHGAIVHYEPTEETDVEIKPEGLLLADSGGQYLDGTTDITRTIPLGDLTYEMRRDYTLVLKGWIQLGAAVFPKGTCGTQLDGFARMAMWKYGINYLHGTGHGVGSYMSVHECIDQHQFRMNWKPTPLLPGMTITDEPGIYIEGSHGVRHENTMLVVEAMEGIVFGPYYQFEHLTLCPVATSPIILELLTEEELAWLNNYHAAVYDRLSPRLDDEHQAWLAEATKPI